MSGLLERSSPRDARMSNVGVCRFHAMGLCRHGENCLYLHDVHIMDDGPFEVFQGPSCGRNHVGNQIAGPSQTTVHSLGYPTGPQDDFRIEQSSAHQNHKEKPKSKRTNKQDSYQEMFAGTSAVDTTTQTTGQGAIRSTGIPAQTDHTRHTSNVHRMSRPPPHCIQWKDGNCLRGTRCFFLHDPAIQEAERVRKAKVAEEDAAKNIQRTLKSARVTFGAGLSIRRIVTGFDSCSIVVKNLPSDATKREVVALFTQPGFDPDYFEVVSLRKSTERVHQEAYVVFESAEDGNVAVAGLDGLEFREEKLKLELSAARTSRAMSSADRDCEVLTVTWPEPYLGAVAHYATMEEAEAKAKSLDKQICVGRKVRVAMNLTHFVATAITINGLVPDTTIETMQTFSGSPSVKLLKGRSYDLSQSHVSMYSHLETLGGLIKYSIVDSGGSNGSVSVKARFGTWAQAKRGFDSLKNKPLDFIGGSKAYVSLPDQFTYTRCVPLQQYKAQKTVLDQLTVDSDVGAARVRIRENGRFSDKLVQILVSGENQEAVGGLKVRLERLLEGERFDLWDQSFGSPGEASFLSTVLETTGAYVSIDIRLRLLKAFGTPAAVNEARKRVEEEVQRLASLDHTVPLKRHCIRFFVREGLSALQELLGKDNVKLDVTSLPPSVTIRGGEDARHALRRIIGQSLEGTHFVTGNSNVMNCPICFDNITNPFVLACGHAYCSNCLRHFLSTASDTKRLPLACMGDENRCGREIAIPVLEKFLRPAELDRLLEVAFVTYIDQRPLEYSYCSTPDCSQIYRRTKPDASATSLQCPSCFLAICSAGHEAHQGQTCEEWRIQRDPEEQERLLSEWATSQDARACPSCKTVIEKDGGCNHIACRCGAHICWNCMGTFESRDIYDHLTNVHGGYIDLPP